ncbi:MAG: hypothetical protein QOH56_1044 [Pseudonocardiales bacterium]|nr:hypothetical protein [Pseudonocardiales bacterium]
MIELLDVTPAAEEGWWLLFELADDNRDDWLLVGGQMMYLLAAEHSAPLPRTTDDIDVVVNVRTLPGGTQWLSAWLIDRDFEEETPSADGISHRFSRPANPGPGRVVFDVLAPEGLGERTSILTVPPGRTVEAPGATQAFDRSELVGVVVSGLPKRGRRNGIVRRPNVLGALVAKAAAATEIRIRQNPERDWQDAALLLTFISDPLAVTEELTAKDRKRLGGLRPMLERDHIGWATLTTEDYRLGRPHCPSSSNHPLSPSLEYRSPALVDCALRQAPTPRGRFDSGCGPARACQPR